ncbi:MAG: energy-coupling factor transporter transmembrane protein EcfT [Fibrobacter sp.]|nr:energy-coupling factor transporter transmembrane protein EcfT [Fibrobacter sp.]
MGYFNRNTRSPFGTLDIRIKITIGLSVSLLVILVDTIVALCTGAVIGTLCFALCYPNRKQVILVTGTTFLVVWGLMFSQALFYSMEPRHALFVLIPPNSVLKEGVKIYYQGIYYGAIQSLRIIGASLTGFAICFSTEPDQFLRGLISLKIPYSLSFIAVSAIRFIPITAREIATVRNAMKLKGYKPFKTGIVDTIHSEIASLLPVLAGTIRRSQEIALSIQTRGFSMDGKRSSWSDTSLSISNVLLLSATIITISAVFLCKVLFWLYQWELYYLPQLRPLYGFVRFWL